MSLKKYIAQQTEAAPLAAFRIFFGLMMLMSIIRFWANGWIEKLYIEPQFFFSYYGFEWVKPIGNYTYILFIICAIAAVFVMIGLKYRWAILIFFLSFTYIELMDKTTYLNHYYFVSVLSFLMIFLPASAYFSVDAFRDRTKAFQKIPRWSIDSIKLLLSMVYIFAGLAKLNSDWLLKAMPLKIWLPSKYEIPILGQFLNENWAHYAFSWGGAFYDLAIPFFLLYRKTRPYAFIAVVVFHLLTRVLFPIGMFPYIMIVAALIFFDASLHHKILDYISRAFRIPLKVFDNGKSLFLEPARAKVIQVFLIGFFTIQMLFPFRYLAYPGELFWTEEGYRFSWRVMLMEKAGYAQFKIVDGRSGKWFYVDNTDFLTPFQEKQMSFQPDFILEYAHYLRDHFETQGHKQVEVYVESRVALNGRRSTPLVNPKIDLAQEKESFEHKNWLLPFSDEIKGI
ncbi:MAG: HTTM domain-containing protein [Pricia sp.]